MGVRHNQPDQLLPAGRNESQIWHLHRRTYRSRHLLQGDPAVHCDPLSVMSEEIEVHANLSTAA